MREIRCQKCNFLIGFSSLEAEAICIYCQSEKNFILAEINGEWPFIYATIPEDKSHYRRGLMHSNKKAIRQMFEDDENGK